MFLKEVHHVIIHLSEIILRLVAVICFDVADTWLGMTIFFFYGATAPSEPGSPHYRGFTITLRHATLGRTPLDRREVQRREHTTLTRDRYP